MLVVTTGNAAPHIKSIKHLISAKLAPFISKKLNHQPGKVLWSPHSTTTKRSIISVPLPFTVETPINQPCTIVTESPAISKPCITNQIGSSVSSSGVISTEIETITSMPIPLENSTSGSEATSISASSSINTLPLAPMSNLPIETVSPNIASTVTAESSLIPSTPINPINPEESVTTIAPDTSILVFEPSNELVSTKSDFFANQYNLNRVPTRFMAVPLASSTYVSKNNLAQYPVPLSSTPNNLQNQIANFDSFGQPLHMYGFVQGGIAEFIGIPQNQAFNNQENFAVRFLQPLKVLDGDVGTEKLQSLTFPLGPVSNIPSPLQKNNQDPIPPAPKILELPQTRIQGMQSIDC